MNRSAVLSFLSPVTFSRFSFCCSAYRFAVFIRDDGHTHTVHERASMPYLKWRALVHHESGLPLPFIVDALAQEGLSATRQGIAKLIFHCSVLFRMSRVKGSGQPLGHYSTIVSFPDPHVHPRSGIFHRISWHC